VLPESCKMPDLSHLESLIPGFMTAIIGFNGELLTEKERLYVRVFVRLVDKAINEYITVRNYIIKQVEDMKHQGGNLYYFGIVNHMDTCINTTRRLFNILESIKRQHGGLTIDSDIRKRIERHKSAIKNIRDSEEHINEVIQLGKTSGPFMLSITDDDMGVKIANHTVKFDDLAQSLQYFHKMAFQWLDDYCKKPT